MSNDELRLEYEAKLHAIQTGVKFRMEYDPSITDLKHIRVGLDSCFVNDAALTRILVKKGLITDREYMEALVQEARDEVDRSTALLVRLIKERTGREVKIELL